MEIKTSKIQEVINVGEPYGQYKVLYHKLVMDNGDKIDIGKQQKQEVGTELTYQLLGDTGQEYRRAKTHSNFQPTHPIMPKAQQNEKTELSIVRCALIKAAAVFHQGRNSLNRDILETARYLEKYALDQETEVVSFRKDDINSDDMPF